MTLLGTTPIKLSSRLRSFITLSRQTGCDFPFSAAIRLYCRKILLALAIAATNHQIQQTYSARKLREESVDIRIRRLRKYPGEQTTWTPQRT